MPTDQEITRMLNHCEGLERRAKATITGDYSYYQNKESGR